MYTVTVHHHDKAWRNGDLEDKFELIDSRNFKTRKAAKDWIENQLAEKPQGDVKRYYTKSKTEPSRCYYWTGVKWQHENSGEQMEEYYQYTLRKGKLN